jgi:hypothetical protein
MLSSVWIQFYQVSKIPLDFIYFFEVPYWFYLITVHTALVPGDLKSTLMCFGHMPASFLLMVTAKLHEKIKNKIIVDSFEQ